MTGPISISRPARPPFRRWKPLSQRLLQALLAAAFLLLSGHFPAWAQSSKEYQVKAVFLFRLAQFVEWPTNAFENDTSPIIIGVLGEDPFGEALDLALKGETAHNRPLLARRFRRVEEIGACHILFISHSEIGRIKAATTALAGRPILTVSDTEDFVRTQNGMIRFYNAQNKVNLRIDAGRAKAENLILNSRLLRMAELVNNGSPNAP